MPKSYSVKEAAAILGFSTNTIYSFLKTQKIHGIRIGKGRFRISQSEIERVVEHPLNPTEDVTIQEVQRAPKLTLFQNPAPFLRHLSLIEWFLGIASILFGLSMYISVTPVEQHFNAPFAVVWYGIIRLLAILFGCGFLVSKLFSAIPLVWGTVYHILLTALFGWLSCVAYMTSETQEVSVGVFLFVVCLLQLFFVPAYHTMICTITALIAVSTTVLYVAFPSVFTEIVYPFLVFVPITPVVTSVVLGIPYLIFILLAGGYRWKKPLYYSMVLLLSIASFVISYFLEAHLFWRQGILMLFVGLTLFLYTVWQTRIMKMYKQTWITTIVFGMVLLQFVMVISALKVFESTMYTRVNRELQVKVENGKLFLDTLFEYAQTSFTAQATDENLLADIKQNNRNLLMADAKRLYEQYPHMANVLIFDATGTEISNYPEDPSLVGVNFAYRQYYQQALLTEKTYFSNAFLTIETFPRYTVVMATPVLDHGAVKGFLVASFDMHGIGRELQSFVADEKGEYFSVTDQKGVRIIHPDPDAIGVPLPKETVDKFMLGSYWKDHLDTRLNIDGELALATYRTTDFGNLTISVVQPYQENLQSNMIALALSCVVWVYGYILILMPWVICQRRYKTTEQIP